MLASFACCKLSIAYCPRRQPMLHKLVIAVLPAEFLQAFYHLIFTVCRAIKNHKTAAAGPRYFAAGSAGLFCGFINFFHQ